MSAERMRSKKTKQRDLDLVTESTYALCIVLGPGPCEEVKFRVLKFIKETEEIVSASNASSFPLGESFLVAKGIQLTSEELGLPPLYPSREAFSEKFLRGSEYAIRLAAQSSKCCFEDFLSISLGETRATGSLGLNLVATSCQVPGKAELFYDPSQSFT